MRGRLLIRLFSETLQSNQPKEDLTMRILALLFSSALLVAFMQHKDTVFPAGTVVDLSYPFNAQTVYWPTAEAFHLEKDFEGVTEKGYYYSAYKYAAAEHGGTHIDAPVHFAKGHNTVDQIPLEQLMGPAIVIDVTSQCGNNPDYRVSTEDFQNWEKQNGKIPAASIVLLRTGFGKYYPDRKTYLGTEERGAAAVAKLHFPGLHPDAARWLTTARSIKAIGLDTASID